MAIHGNVLYVIAPKGKAVQRFDLHTGKDLGDWNASVLGGDALKWLAIWQNTTCSVLDLSHFGLETEGAMTIAQGRLWIRGNAFNLTDGTLTVDRRYPYIFPNPVTGCPRLAARSAAE
jgi:hypothetical protein